MADNKPTDAVELTRALIRCDSVTPRDGGALAVTSAALDRLGFESHRMTFSAPDTPDVDNLYARLGSGGRNFCFAGHTDVVPVGDADAWSLEPFAADIRDGILYGRGATDMKGAVAAFIAAVDTFLAKRGGDFDGSISLLITGDEEGPSINGTRKVLDWLDERGEKLDHCLVGEPTNPENLGDMVKIGRRGSLSGTLVVRGTQGHVAYPHLADNPLP
ncbi:MAG: succinyl-diaminopimelate desuccinylase, partial [Rhodospirillaceae bacterium]|nr:succinyl-diaminopimelate desuccinylase [Rhodospirillaceae bacterium]